MNYLCGGEKIHRVCRVILIDFSQMRSYYPLNFTGTRYAEEASQR